MNCENIKSQIYTGVGCPGQKPVKKEFAFVHGFLNVGEENAIQASTLSKLCGRSEREIRKCVEQCRRAGMYILSTNNGYFLPELDEDGQLSQKGYMEVKRYCGRTLSMAKSLFIASCPAEKLCREYEQEHSTYEQLSIPKQGDYDGK